MTCHTATECGPALEKSSGTGPFPLFSIIEDREGGTKGIFYWFPLAHLWLRHSGTARPAKTDICPNFPHTPIHSFSFTSPYTLRRHPNYHFLLDLLRSAKTRSHDRIRDYFWGQKFQSRNSPHTIHYKKRNSSANYQVLLIEAGQKRTERPSVVYFRNSSAD